MRKRNAELVLLLLVAMWGLSFSLMKPLLSQMGVFNLLAYRFLIGGVVVIGFWFFNRPKTVDLGAIKAGISTGILLFIVFYFHVEGLKYTSVAKNAFVVGSSVVFVPIVLALVYREKQTRMTAIQTVLALIGLAMITLTGIETSLNYGDILTIIGTIVLAFYTIQIEKYMQKYDALTFSAAQITSVGVLSLIGTLLFETPVISFSTGGWASILFLSVFLTGVAYMLTNEMQKHVNAARVSLIYTMEPFFATLFGWMFLAEVIGTNIVLGGTLMTISLTMPYLLEKFQDMDRWKRIYSSE